MQPFYTQNDSEIPLLEGLYIQERNPPATVPGANLNVVGIVGECVRGPVDKLITIGSEKRFIDVFGGRDRGSGGAIAGKVWLSILNKPFGTLVITRAAAAAAVAAHSNLMASAVAILTMTASSPGAWGGDVTYDIANPSDGNINHFKLTVHYLGTDYVYDNLDVSGANDNTLAAIGTDDARIVDLTKLASGRPDNVSNQTLGTSGGTPVAGSDGSIADSDFTATNRGVNLLVGGKTADGTPIGVVFIAERSSATLKAYMQTIAATTMDRIFLIGPDNIGDTPTTVETDAQTYASAGNKQLAYTYNAPYTIDPQTATEVQTRPESWMASILSQTDVDIHPGEDDTKQFTAGITRLTFPGLVRADYKALKAARICALEQDNGFAFVSCPMLDGREMTERRMRIYLEVSASGFLRGLVKKKLTATRRASARAVLGGWLRGLQDQERIVDGGKDADDQFQVDTDKLNPKNPLTGQYTQPTIFRILTLVRLVPHALEVVLVTQISADTIITTTQGQ